MINMAAILVVFLNILIGQISYRYEEALDNASIYYDIDRCTLVAKAERTPFKSFLVIIIRICFNNLLRFLYS